MGSDEIVRRLQRFADRGVEIVDPRQTFIGAEVQLERVCEGATLHPGTRLYGARTFVGPGADVGSEGPATLRDAVLGPKTSVASGYVEGAVLLEGSSVGYAAHVRPGTVLEEQASTAHCVGLKHTVLLSFVTLGSLINFCDCLMTGGSSRTDHSEVGSGFIHFNFTPWGERGDKATPSLVGDVPAGVFLRERRIFLGGAGGLIGPGQLGFGAITGAGQVVRKPVAEGTLSVQSTRSLAMKRGRDYLDPAQPRAGRNVSYIGNLVALRAWYRDVRRARLRPGDLVGRAVVKAALENLDLCIAERVKRLASFLNERGMSSPALTLEPDVPCPLDVAGDSPTGSLEHVEWVRALDAPTVASGTTWLRGIVEAVERSAA